MPAKPFEFPPKFDPLSKHGAGILCDAVMDFWAKQGFGNVRAERFPVPDTASWGVKSNLVGGLPPPRARKTRRWVPLQTRA